MVNFIDPLPAMKQNAKKKKIIPEIDHKLLHAEMHPPRQKKVHPTKHWNVDPQVD